MLDYWYVFLYGMCQRLTATEYSMCQRLTATEYEYSMCQQPRTDQTFRPLLSKPLLTLLLC